jgi:ATP synthase F1 gamma subunit
LYLKKFKDISKAVQLVAIAKLRKLSKQLESRDFSLSLAVELFDDNDVANGLFKNYTVVIITSERSCCGKLNSDVLSASKDAVESFIEENKIVSIISIGWKGRNSLFPKFKSELCKSVSSIGKVSLFLAYTIAICVYETFFDKCFVYFSKYYKIFEQVASVYCFKSFSFFLHSTSSARLANFFFDLLAASGLLSLNNTYVYNICLIILDAFEETKYSELGCRAFSMEMAHRNATELIIEKMLIYNKARQAGITTDLLEVVAGSIYTV